MIAAAIVLLAASAAIYLAGWFRKADSDLDRHIDEALAVGNAPDLDGNVAFFDRQGVTR